MSVKKCVICGNPFSNRGKSITCSEECKVEQRKRYIAKRRGHPIAINRQIPGLSIQEINKLAAEHGTTYGKMAAMLRDGKYPEG